MLELLQNLGMILLVSWVVVEHPLPYIIMELINDWVNPKKIKIIEFALTKWVQCYKCSALYIGIVWCVVFGLPWWVPIMASFIMKLYDQKLNTIRI